MKVNRFSHRQDGSGPIARERLKLMAESAPFEHSPAAARRKRKFQILFHGILNFLRMTMR